MDYEITKIIVKLEERIEALEERIEALEKRLDTETNEKKTTTGNWKLIVSPKGNNQKYKEYVFDTGISKDVSRSDISAGISPSDDVYIIKNKNKIVFINLSPYTTDENGRNWYSAKYVWEVFIN